MEKGKGRTVVRTRKKGHTKPGTTRAQVPKKEFISVMMIIIIISKVFKPIKNEATVTQHAPRVALPLNAQVIATHHARGPYYHHPTVT